MKKSQLLICLFLIFLFTSVYAEKVLWFDGTVTNAPSGRLLTDNEDYWGESILTGVDYTYAVAPDSPADNRADRTNRIGRVLFNGNQGAGVGIREVPLVVIFDFKRICSFYEWTIITTSRNAAVTLAMRGSVEESWREVYSRAQEECPDRDLQRFELADSPQGRFVRLTLEAPGITELREVLAWGDSADDVAEFINPVAHGPYPVGVAYPTLTGIEKSSISDRESFYWAESLKPEHKKQAAVWARVPTWSSVSNKPIAPDPETVNQPIHVVMARNETEAVALTLRNTLVDSPREVEVRFHDFKTSDGTDISGIKGSLGVFGIIGDRAFGNNVGPIFEGDNLLGKSLMRKYLLNGAEIENFPKVVLQPSGAAAFWLSITTDHAEPGIYRSSIQIVEGEQVPVTVEVLDVTLPMVFAHVKTYSSNRTSMFPFEYLDRAKRDIKYALDCGISDWNFSEQVQQMATDRGMKLLYNLGMLIPHWTDPTPDYVGMIWLGQWAKPSDFPENAPEEVRKKVSRVVEKARELGLAYDEWYGSTGDEPGEKNIEAVAYMCRLIKKANPNVNIYVNPAYWTGFDHGGVSDDETVIKGLRGTGTSEDWYRKHVDISMPLMLLLRDRPKAFKEFSSPRLVNSYYYVSGHLDRSEQRVEIEKYRRMAWNSYSKGFNGWAFYAYYSPRGSGWNHFDKAPIGEGLPEPSDYQIVYAGHRGVIRTRHSEALREGWEDWRLLHLLKEKNREYSDEILRKYRKGASMEELRIKALKKIAATQDMTN